MNVVGFLTIRLFVPDKMSSYVFTVKYLGFRQLLVAVVP